MDMIVDIREAQEEWEGKGVALVADATARFINDHDQQALEEAVLSHAAAARAAWNQLAEDLMAKYANGYLNTPGGQFQALGYPRAWLHEIGYQKHGPPDPP